MIPRQALVQTFENSYPPATTVVFNSACASCMLMCVLVGTSCLQAGQTGMQAAIMG